MTEYRIDYTIIRCLDGEEMEIGFGSSGSWKTLDAAAYAVTSDIQNGTWETEPGHPDPDDVLAEIAYSNNEGATP